MNTTSIVWFRRDLRLDDHVALLRAAEASERVVCAFVLDPVLLRGPRVGPPIVQAFFDALRALRASLRAGGSDLVLLEGDAGDELQQLARRCGADALYYNVDYDPDATVRDGAVAARLQKAGVQVHASLDHVYYGAAEIVQPSDRPYAVFAPYRKRWTARLAEDPRPPAASAAAVRGRLAPRAAIGPSREVPVPEDYGHASSTGYPRVDERSARGLLDAFAAGAIDAYADRRNIPALTGTSHLSPHLRAGTIGIRTVVRAAAVALAEAPTPHARANVESWLGELIWRDFYQQILAHHPRVAREPFVERAQAIPYVRDDAAFAAWTEGRTGYPIVDAAMLQLRTCGWMHNRLRMIVASFLTKHLLIDYREGERWFEMHLADADLAANNGGWQWAASTGTDAAPYFRVFNPTLQGKSYDRNGTFVRRWIPALANVPDAAVHDPWLLAPLLQEEYACVIGRDYPAPIVDHAFARQRAIAVYGTALGKSTSDREIAPFGVPGRSPQGNQFL